MLKCCAAFLFLYSHWLAAADRPQLKVMVIFAHPDEGEIYTGGTVALYTRLGHKVRFLSLTNGDAGHFSMKPEDLAQRRYKEAMEAKRILGLDDYEVLPYHDQKLKDNDELRQIVVRRIQDFNPDVVYTYFPAAGGHTDNMTAGWIVRNAAPSLMMAELPVFLYVRDYFTSQLSYVPDFAISIDDVWETKLRSCGAHESQVLESNPYNEGILEQVRASKERQQEFLFNNTYPFSQVTPDILLALERWYGKQAASRVQYAEAFEIAEFGRQISETEVRQLIPMIGSAKTVPGRTKWLDTGVDLDSGQLLELTAEGRIQWKSGENGTCGPDGAVPYTRWGNKPMPSVSTGALIGKIGEESADCFSIGASRTMIAFGSGRLFVGINDDNVSDNYGAFRIWIRVGKGK